MEVCWQQILWFQLLHMATMLLLLNILLIRSYGRNPSGVKPQDATTTTTILCNCGNCKPRNKLVLDEKWKGSAPKGDTLKPRLLHVFINLIPYTCFSRAFDKFAYDIFFSERLRNLGFDGNFLEQINFCIRGRKQLVTIGCVRSRLGPVSSGGPQGSVLGPLYYYLL